MSALRFEITGRSASGRGRVGRITTLHGTFETPAFMVVGTKATVKGLPPWLVAQAGAKVVLANTYHLLLRPGPEMVARRGGLHRFMGWGGPILTDSGGYQVYSMSDISRIDDDGVRFRSIVDGREIHLTPELSIDAQNKLGADIIMAFDDCPPSVDPKTTNQTRQRLAAGRSGGSGLPRRDPMRGMDHSARLDLAEERTIRWLERCRAAHARSDEQALFGIIQGGTELSRRTRCVERVCSIDLPGYAIGGVAVGEGFTEITNVVSHTAALMPEDKPRYLMGVGYERDLVMAARAGVDMFDCVLPTRNGRNANAFTRSGQVRLRNARFAEDDGPIDEGCDCPACDPAGHGWATPGGGPFGRAYIRHLFLADEMLGAILVSLHNVRHFQRLMAAIRAAILSDDWQGLASAWPVAAEGCGL